MRSIRADPSDGCCLGRLHLTFTLNGPDVSRIVEQCCPNDIALFIVSQLSRDKDILVHLDPLNIAESTVS